MDALFGAVSGLAVGEVSTAALLGLAILALLRGWLVPRSVLDDVRRDRDTRLADCQAQITDWRDAYRAADARADILAGQVDELVHQARTTEQVLQSLARVAEAKGRYDRPPTPKPG